MTRPGTGNLHSETSQHQQPEEADSSVCLPPELRLEEDNSVSHTESIAKICTSSSERKLAFPTVFHSKLNVVKITYIWVENHSSGFTVGFDFHLHNSSCVHICDERRVCLSDHQVCNRQYDCDDKSDEQSCLPLSHSTAAEQSAADVDVLKALAVIISLVLMPALLITICVVSPCPLRSRMFRRHRRSRERLEHSRPDSQVSEVVYVPTSSASTSQDKLLEHQISQVRQHQQQVRSVRTDTMLDLPPQIPISKDGEEGYIDSQKHLMCSKRPKYIDQVFRPPPNKTVHDRESPPPYYSNSPSLENLGKPARIVKENDSGCTRLIRCYSMSSANTTAPASPVISTQQQDTLTQQQHTATKTHTRTLSTNISSTSAGRTRNLSSPTSASRHTHQHVQYEDICSSDNNNQLSLRVDSV